MCNPAVAMAGVGAAQGIMQARETAKAEGAAEDARRKNQIEMIRQMNYQNADLQLSLRDKHEQAQQQLTEINLTSLRNTGLVNAAIGESGISGASMDRIKRVTQAETSRERVGVMDNYQRDYQAIFADQVSNVENTKTQLRTMPKVRRTSLLSHALNIAAGTAQGAATGYGLKE